MITFSRFGNYGRLGNQLFQISCLDSLSKKIGVDYFLHESLQELKDIKKLNLENLKSCKWLSTKDYINEYHNSIKFLYQENSFSYDEKINLVQDNFDVIGYFQSKKYHIDSDIEKIFNFNTSSNDYCFIHVRRGDYVAKSNYHFNLCSTSYYQDSMNLMKSYNKDIKFLFVSDDIDYCKSFFGHNIDVFSTTDTIDSLKEMLECKYAIIANSSYSWWGAQYNKNKVISPKNWFGSDGPTDTDDIHLPNWSIL